MKTPINPVNFQLSIACQQAEASCCKAGMLFLPEDEYKAIVSWLTDNLPTELNEFETRCVNYDRFYLYDQKDCCQFLMGLKQKSSPNQA